jgi:hypothetical protein
MKKIMAIVLVLLMVVSLFACNQGTNTSSTPSPSTTPPTSPSSDTTSPSADPTVNPVGGEIGMYDPNYDYTANPRYKVQYIVLQTQGLYEAMNDAFEHWASLMNIEYLGMQDYGGDKDAYLSNLPTLAKANDGLLVDPDAMQYNRVAEILDELGTPWMGCMAAPRDYEAEGKPLIHPFAGFDNYQIGYIFGETLIKYKDKFWPDVPIKEFGFITVDYSVSAPLHSRETGCKDALTASAPELMDRYFVADTSINTFDVDTSSQVVTSVLAQHPDIEYWLIFAEVEDMAKGAAVAIDTMGLTDNTCIADFGCVALQAQWDAGQQDAWRVAGWLSQTIYAEPMIGALYAFMNGDASPETIWPNWINVNDCGGESGTYASRLLPFYWMEYDNYKEMMKWSDLYAGSNNYPNYPADGITRDSYSSGAEVPAYYKTTT